MEIEVKPVIEYIAPPNDPRELNDHGKRHVTHTSTDDGEPIPAYLHAVNALCCKSILPHGRQIIQILLAT